MLTGISSRSIVGEALVADGLITSDQLSRALKIQQLLEQPRTLGEVLIELGYVTRHGVNECIARNGRGMRIGDILCEQGLITRETLDTALTVQKTSNRPLGQILIDLGFINERVLLKSLASQAQVPYIEPSFAMIDRSALSGVSPDFLAKNLFLPFSRNDDGTLLIVVPDLQSPDIMHAIEEVYQGAYRLALGPSELIRATVDDFRRFRTDKPADRAARPAEGDDSVVHIVEHLIVQAVAENASDIHIEPMQDTIRVRYRIDGVLLFKTDLPKDLHPRIVSRIMVMAEGNITEHQRHQGGRILFQHDGNDYDLRVSSYVTVHGECVVLRVLNKQVGLVSLDELGMNASMLERFRNDVLDLSTGVVIITGPTGSGKTTTLYSCLDYANQIDRKIITVEDPVEYVINGIIQCSVHDRAGRTFESSLREIVRQDPDIIVLGEIRDHITAATAIQAALTGHKVYSTFHTEDTIGGLVRLLNMEIEAFLISSTVLSVVAQRLLRRICDACAMAALPNATEVRRLGLDMADLRQFEFRKGHGCVKCNYTGYRGRIGVYELLVMNDEVKEAILEKRPAHVIRKICTDTTGLICMREDGVGKVIRGKTTFEEVLKQTPHTFEMRPLHQILAMTR